MTATDAKERETALLKLSTIEARVVQAEDALSDVSEANLTADEVAELRDARWALRTLAQKVGARYRALKEQTMKETNQ